jgi:hypothetical protein
LSAAKNLSIAALQNQKRSSEISQPSVPKQQGSFFMKTQRTIYALIIGLFVTSAVAQVPPLLNYQGRVVVGTTNFDGSGLFKFALVNSNGTVTFWSNDGTSAGGSTPTASVSLPVARGLYSVLLGDTSLAGMPTALPATVFTNVDVRLRVWFNDGVTGVQQFTPDQRIAAVGYALMGANVPDGAITSNKLANGAVTGVKIADGSITSAKLALNTISSSNIADSITLGETNVNGQLDVYRTGAGTPAISLVGSASRISTYGSDGLEQIRLWGASYGELWLNNSLSNNATAVLLTAQGSTGGRLSLNNTNGSSRAVLEGENTGGLLTLYQADGQPGAVLYGNEGAGAGALSLRNTNGSARVRLFGQSPDSGGGEIAVNDDNGSEVIELKGNSSGGQLTIKDDTGVRTTAFLGSSVGGYQYLYNGLGNISVYLDGDSGGGGYASLRNTNGSSRVILDGFSTGGGGGISLYDSDGTETIEILGAEGTGAGGQILMRNAAGVSTIQLDSDASGVRCGYLALYNSNGVATIILDAAGSGDGRITTQVLQITGGSDLSEQFDIKALHDGIKPGMIVSIDADHAGQLVTSSKAYDKTVAGIVSGAGGVQTGMLMGQRGTAADGKHPVALTGRVYCWVDADQGAIRPGDLITTSDTPGHGMKVTDHGRAQGAIIGKAMSSLDKGRGLVLVLVSLQ